MKARLLAALLPVALCAPALAQEPAERPALVAISQVEKVEALSDPAAGEAFALVGRVTIDIAGFFSVEARRAVVWLDPDADATVFDLVRELGKEGAGIPLWTVRAIYAEGGRLPAVFQAAGHVFRCSSLYYDFQRHRGVFLDASLRLRRDPDRSLAPDLVLRARELRAVEPGTWRARDVTFFSSNYHEHEVTVEAEEVVLSDPHLAEALGRLTVISARGYRDGQGPTREEVDALLEDLAEAGPALGPKRLTLEGLRAKLLGVPFFGWKKIDVLGEDVLPVRLVLEAGSIGSLGEGFLLGGGLKVKPVGFVVAGGYVDRRGPLGEAEIELDAWGGAVTGRLFGAYLHDHGTDFGTPPPTRDRYWTQNRVRWLASETWRLDVEYDDLSDATFLRVYDEGEFKEGKERETYAYLRRRGALTYVTLVGRWRTIPFDDYREELPRLRGDLPVLTLVRLGEDVRLQLAGGIEAANLRHRAADGSLLSDFRTTRFDVDPTLLLAFPAGPLRVVPFATFRFSAYDEALDGSSPGRFAGSAGVRIDAQLSRWFGGVRHVVNLSLEYEDLYALTEDASNLFPIDATDLVRRWEGISLRWRNRLQRRTEAGLVEFFSLEVHGAFFPDGERPLGVAGDWFVDVDGEWRVTRRVWLEGRVSHDPDLGNTGSFGTWWQARADLLLHTSYRYLEGDSDIVTLAAELMVHTRWRLVGFSQFDLRTEDALDQGLLVQRVGKTAVVGLRFSWDPGPDDFRFGVKIDLLEAFLSRRRAERDSLRREIGWK